MTAAETQADRSALLRAVDQYDAADLVIPCRSGDVEPAASWTSDDPADQRAAAALCGPCPALDACRTFGTTYGDQAGVYGGITEHDRKPRRGRPPTTTSSTKESAA